MLLLSLSLALLSLTNVIAQTELQAANLKRFSGPLSSQPLALSADDSILAVANPDNNSVSFFRVKHDQNRKFDEVTVQTEPQGVALTPDGSKAFVANTVSGTVSVIKVSGSGNAHDPHKHIPTGTEPYSLVMSPNGTRLYVANARSNSISVIDTYSEQVVSTIQNVGFEPRGLAITNDNDDNDSDETLYVTNFLSAPIAGKVDGADDAKAGKVYVIPVSTGVPTGAITINPIADTGFKALGNALGRIPPGSPADPANFKFPTGAYPNQLNNVAIKGNFAYLPNTGSSPNGPFRFDVNTQSLLAVVDRLTNQDAKQTINMHLAVAQQTNPAKRFITVPWAMAFEHLSNEGWVVSAASNIAIKVVVDPTTGAATVQKDPTDPSRVLQLALGKNPRGIVINGDDTRAYVANHVSRDVTVLALSDGPERVVGTFSSADLPIPGSQADKIQIGKELYHTSVGVFDPAPGTTAPIVGRMSNNGWGACSTCHPFGLSDNVVWIFPSGPKRTLPQHTDFDHTDPTRSIMRVLNWSAERDEQEDFELNIRAVSGGQGLIVLADGITQDPQVFNLLPLASANRNQLKVRSVNAWDAIKAYVQFGIRSPISPVPKNDPDVIAGETLFRMAKCEQCHGGPQWTSGRVRFTPPPIAAQVVGGQIIAELRKVGTFDPGVFNEVNTNGAPAIGADGFVPPSLLSNFAFTQSFLHNGILQSLDQVLNNVTHRSAGTGGVDTLTNAADRAKVVKFILSIDEATPPINP